MAQWAGAGTRRLALPVGELPYDTEASVVAPEPLEPTTFQGALGMVRKGRNTLAVMGINVSPDSSDFFLDLRLELIDPIIVPSGTQWRYSFPAQLAVADPWRDPDYDDSAWLKGTAPFMEFRQQRHGTLVPELLE